MGLRGAVDLGEGESSSLAWSTCLEKSGSGAGLAAASIGSLQTPRGSSQPSQPPLLLWWPSRTRTIFTTQTP